MGCNFSFITYPVSKVHGANMGPTWVLSAPDGPHVGPMNLAIRVVSTAVKLILKLIRRSSCIMEE